MSDLIRRTLYHIHSVSFGRYCFDNPVGVHWDLPHWITIEWLKPVRKKTPRGNAPQRLKVLMKSGDCRYKELHCKARIITPAMLSPGKPYVSRQRFEILTDPEVKRECFLERYDRWKKRLFHKRPRLRNEPFQALVIQFAEEIGIELKAEWIEVPSSGGKNVARALTGLVRDE